MSASSLEPDLFTEESAVLAAARALHADDGASVEAQRRMLGELVHHYERLMRETRRLIRRSDRAERDMHVLNRELQALAGQLEYRATHDPLTGALNRGAVIEQASSLLAQGDMALIVLDIDLFKQVNDDFGHPAGDCVIRAVVDCLQDLLGQYTPIGRVGGEEFSVVWPTSSREEARQVAQDICDAIAARQPPAPITRPVTVSVGMSWNRAGTTFENAYSHADQALYQAKRDGRNCVRVWRDG
ncbi:GGDEF domain-containing protein [Janthinobacterium sp. PC23-8]|uniref:GGDEF domain-containing protein n=1 Tax=Janthinobacterium sp. PC23-8 TaxID=2012679 RepID=UPI000B95D181|nr:GGDEF domain-containing protein [Janthinobacterium sp. PC23-8]OYO32344.1 GGDEF domain-containing protein [Janthinobacterium sp. PC23-8]